MVFGSTFPVPTVLNVPVIYGWSDEFCFILINSASRACAVADAHSVLVTRYSALNTETWYQLSGIASDQGHVSRCVSCWAW